MSPGAGSERLAPLIARTWSPAKAALLGRLVSRPVTIAPHHAVVSFTFDDVPVSVLEHALPVLDRHGVKATFYVAPQMSPGEERVLGDGDIRRLGEAGHHIGCHTLTHYSLRSGTADGLYEDALAGKRALEALLGQAAADHFSYPYGEVSVRAKALLQPLFATMRTSYGGINSGRVDLNLLRAESLYSRGAGLDLRRIRRLVEKTVAHGGWLVLYTHGVRHDPGPYDTTPEDFREAVALAAGCGAQILPVAAALDSIRAA